MNYGHTFGHAIEAISDYRIAHGQAVSIGIIIANELGREYGLMSQEHCTYLNRLALDLLDASAVEIMREFNSSKLLNLLRKDKKSGEHQSHTRAHDKARRNRFPTDGDRLEPRKHGHEHRQEDVLLK